MKQFATDAWSSVVTYWLIVIEMLLNLTAIICLSITTVLSPVVWASLSGQEKFIVVVGITGLCATNIQAFLSKTAGKIINKQLPSSDTVMITKQKENG